MSQSARYLKIRVRLFKKIQDWILKFERIWKRILSFFIKQIYQRSLGSWCIKGTEDGFSGSFDAPWSERLNCLIKKLKIRFRILSDLRIKPWIFLQKRRRFKLTNKTAHDGVTLFQSFTSLRWIKHQPFNGFYLFTVLLQKKKCRRSYMWDRFPFVLIKTIHVSLSSHQLRC